MRSSTLSLDFSAILQTPVGQEAKLVYAATATRGYQFYGVLTILRGRGFLLLVLFFG